MPAHNAAPFVEQAIRSVQEQTYENIELVVIDDGSQDQTARVVREIAETDGRVTLLQQANQGVAAARNAGIEASRGPYIAPLDADDVWHPQKIARQARCMQEAGPWVGLVYTWWIGIDRAGDFLHASHQWRVEGDVYEALVSLNFIGNASVPLMRRFCVEQAEGYDVGLKALGGQGCEDWDLALRIAARYQLRVVPEHLVGYRRVSGSMSGDGASMHRSYHLIMQKARRERPAVPERVYRWSRSHFERHLAEVDYLEGRYQTMLYRLYKAFFTDPWAAWSPWRVQLLAERLPRPAARVLRSVWREWCTKNDLRPLFDESKTRTYLPAFGGERRCIEGRRHLQPA